MLFGVLGFEGFEGSGLGLGFLGFCTQEAALHTQRQVWKWALPCMLMRAWQELLYPRAGGLARMAGDGGNRLRLLAMGAQGSGSFRGLGIVRGFIGFVRRMRIFSTLKTPKK
jgi:hypothetical protein